MKPEELTPGEEYEWKEHVGIGSGNRVYIGPNEGEFVFRATEDDTYHRFTGSGIQNLQRRVDAQEAHMDKREPIDQRVGRRVQFEIQYVVVGDTDEAQAGVELARFVNDLGRYAKAKRIIVNRTTWPS